jgi:thiol-disulfide isomerase/thioredoxin
MSLKIVVQYTSAEWCKVCKTLLPEIQEMCRKAGVKIELRRYEDLDEEEVSKIKTLPAITVIVNDIHREEILGDKVNKLQNILSKYVFPLDSGSESLYF